MFEDIENMIESGVKKVVAEFEKKPIATSLKGIVVLWILRELSKWFKK